MLVHCLFASLLACSIALTQAQPAPCKKGFSHFAKDNSCVKVYTSNHLSWKDARAVCKAVGGDLVHIDNAEKNVFVSSKISGNFFYWIGATVLKTGKVLDAKGDEVKFKKWAAGKPFIRSGIDHCVRMRTTNHKGDWDNFNCEAKRPFVCSIEAVPTTQVKPSPCQPGYSYFEKDNSCIKVINTQLNWTDARDTCKATNDGHLVHIDSAEKNDFIASKIKGNWFYWIGAHVLKTDLKVLDIEDNQQVYANWASRVVTKYDEKCVRIRTANQKGDWDYFPCYARRPFICGYHPVVKTCQQGYFRYEEGNTCVKVVNSKKRWSAAKDACKAESGNLVIIDSAAKDQFVTAHLNSSDFYWIGLSRQNNEMIHVDGTKMTYANWRPGQPDNWRNIEHCIMKFGNRVPPPLRGLWNDLNCMSSLKYVCEHDL